MQAVRLYGAVSASISPISTRVAACWARYRAAGPRLPTGRPPNRREARQRLLVDFPSTKVALSSSDCDAKCWRKAAKVLPAKAAEPKWRRKSRTTRHEKAHCPAPNRRRLPVTDCATHQGRWQSKAGVWPGRQLQSATATTVAHPTRRRTSRVGKARRSATTGPVCSRL